MVRSASRTRLLGLLSLVLAASLMLATSARAADSYPCGSSQAVSWSTESVQPCPLGSPLPPNSWVPVYRTPVPNPRGANPPAPDGWLHGIEGQRFVCQRPYTSAVYYHPKGWRNYWWAYTLSDDGVWGWVPEVFFRGGLDDERDAGLRECAATVASPPSPATPPPAPPSAGPCDPDGSTPNLKLKATLAGTDRGGATRQGRRVRIVGGLRDAAGNPLPNQGVCVGQIDPQAGALVETATITTDARGHFTYPLSPGSSRRIWFVHRGAAGVVSTSVYVRVRARVGLGASQLSLRNGQTVTLHGRVAGGARSRGVLVEMQARRGNYWQTFGTTHVRRHGNFAFQYRFSRTSGVQHYDLRARIPGQRGYPFAPGASRPVRLTVTG